MKTETLKLKRHETFSIREGWIEKGVNIIKENCECFKKNDGPVNFGLGTNMCKSLRYWLIGSKIAEAIGRNPEVKNEIVSSMMILFLSV